MPTIIATPGAANANSYITVAEADDYHDGFIAPDVWNDASLDEQQRALITATRLLDSHLQWVGMAATDTQALSWPRIYARTRNGFLFDSTVIPQAVKDATADLARRLLESGLPADQGADDLKRLKAGPVDMEFREAAVQPLPEPVFQMVKFLAASDSVGSGVSSVPVIRT